jgi:hypothetical protein
MVVLSLFSVFIITSCIRRYCITCISSSVCDNSITSIMGGGKHEDMVTIFVRARQLINYG